MAASTATKASSCFVYGTLMSPEVLSVLLGRVPTMVAPAILRNHSRHPVVGRVYPGVIPAPTGSSAADTVPTAINTVEGVLLLDITPIELKCLDYFEDEGIDYTRSEVQVTVPCANEDGQPKGEDANGNVRNADAYIWALGKSMLDRSRDWDYEAFLSEQEWYLERTVKPCRAEIERTIL